MLLVMAILPVTDVYHRREQENIQINQNSYPIVENLPRRFEKIPTQPPRLLYAPQSVEQRIYRPTRAQGRVSTDPVDREKTLRLSRQEIWKLPVVIH